MKEYCKKVEAIYKLGWDGHICYVEIKETAKKKEVFNIDVNLWTHQKNTLH